MIYKKEFKYGAQVDMGKDTDKIFRLHDLHKMLFEMLQQQIGYNDDIQLAIYIDLNPDVNMHQYRGSIKSIPVYQQEVQIYKYNYSIAPYWYPTNRKLTIKEKLKILFKGEL